MGRDTVQLETAVNTISHEYLLEFTSKYGIPEILHPVLPGPEDRIVDFPEGKIGWMSFSKRPRMNTLQCYTKPLDSLKNWNNRFFWVDERVFPTVVDLADECPQRRDAGCGHILPRGRTDMDLFNLIRAPNPTKVKVGSRPRAPHEVPLLTLTAPRVIEIDEPAATDSSGVSSTIKRSPLDFAHEAGASDQGAVAPEIPSSEDVPATVASGVGQAEETATMDPPIALESRKRGHDGTDETRGLRMLLPLPRSGLRGVCTDRNGTKAGMKKAAEDKSAGLIKELEDLRARWVIGHGLRLAIMKCAESLEMRQAFADVVSAGVAKGMSKGLKHGVEHGHAQLKVESIEAYDPEAEAKFVAALQSLKDLKHPL
nr:hypothetical protein [Tanacetum cinerariifolium]